MVINGAIVSDLDMMFLESVLQEELALTMMMRYFYIPLFDFPRMQIWQSSTELTAVH